MRFTHDFQADLKLLMSFDSNDRPFAFSRFADGELAILDRRDIPTADGWKVTVSYAFWKALLESLTFSDPDYYLGLGCPCCDLETHKALVSRSGRRLEELDHVTFSNVFVNGNYEDFLQRVQYQHQRTNLTTIGCMPQNPFRVPRNLVNMPGNMEFIDGLVQCLIEDVGACPLFVAAGPASSIIIHRYWMRAKRRRTILDIGSALDLTCGRATRGYHNYDHPNRTKMCRWSNVL